MIENRRKLSLLLKYMLAFLLKTPKNSVDHFFSLYYFRIFSSEISVLKKKSSLINFVSLASALINSSVCPPSVFIFRMLKNIF